ncbi:MAG: hypothetical protein ACOC30_02925, partial [Marinilabilia sp.]
NDRLGKTDSYLRRIQFFLTTSRVIKEILKFIGVFNTFNRDLNCWATLKAIEKTLLKKQKL